jgi:glyoxylase-like metal-dependent hydrolase (beta-lactamase superfamily II)
MQIQTITVGLFQANCFLLTCEETGTSAVIDVGEDDALGARLAAMEPVPRLGHVLITHCHIDHAAGLAELQTRFPDAKTCVPLADRPLFEALPQQGNWFGMPALNRPCGRVDRWLADGDEIAVGALTLRFLATPGHSPGLGCFVGHGHAFVGDTIFAGSIGRTDLPLGDHAEMDRSLARLMELPGETVLHSGHGPDTTIAQELATNPWLAHVRRARGLPEPQRRSWW